jgi:Type I phosphodiesterase / nucleotide pyrophosphatase
MGKGLVILHVDGLSAAALGRALAAGQMPFVRRLLEVEGYQVHPYRCGVPSTTPFVQAGILYGDCSEIPSYRWWDKSIGAVVGFGAGGSFELVANRYFAGRAPLTQGGACIAALFRAGADDRFGPAYGEHHGDTDRQVIVPFLTNPQVVYHWLRHGGSAAFGVLAKYVSARLARRPVSPTYVFADLFHECVVHHLTRFATRQAMAEGLPVIYSCFYTFDEAAHAFGPEDEWSRRILRHLDNTINWVARSRTGAGPREYELLILSDHGQVDCRPFNAGDGDNLGAYLARWLPGYRVTEHRGDSFGPAGGSIAGNIAITYSGGLGHIYFTDLPGRLNRTDLEQRFPGLVQRLADLDRIGFVMVKDGHVGGIVHAQGSHRLDAAAAPFLAHLDEPGALIRQLQRLNSFESSGDLVVFGSFEDNRQVNFENQVGGHGSAGGEQLHPFVLAKREWAVDTAGVEFADQLHEPLAGLVERLASG